jgi:hypothetical protein
VFPTFDRLLPLAAGAAPAADLPADRSAWHRAEPAAGRHRYVLEPSLAWLVGYRRLQVRHERRAEILLGFLHLACALICLKSLNQPTPPGHSYRSCGTGWRCWAAQACAGQAPDPAHSQFDRCLLGQPSLADQVLPAVEVHSDPDGGRQRRPALVFQRPAAGEHLDSVALQGQ